ncbi:MAG: sodium:proton antiporter [Lachnospiraceae bacterium]|nr:sodium:proton antiporter [Candidatus Merdinaster equi]
MTPVIDSILTVMLIILALMVLLCLIKAIIGPRVGDRLVCVNMMGTLVIVIICILAIKMKEGYLVDISIIYAMISFLAVVIFCKVYMGAFLQKKAESEKKEDEANGND